MIWSVLCFAAVNQQALSIVHAVVWSACLFLPIPRRTAYMWRPYIEPSRLRRKSRGVVALERLERLLHSKPGRRAFAVIVTVLKLATMFLFGQYLAQTPLSIGSFVLGVLLLAEAHTSDAMEAAEEHEHAKWVSFFMSLVATLVLFWWVLLYPPMPHTDALFALIVAWFLCGLWSSILTEQRFLAPGPVHLTSTYDLDIGSAP